LAKGKSSPSLQKVVPAEGDMPPSTHQCTKWDGRSANSQARWCPCTGVHGSGLWTHSGSLSLC